MMHFNIILMKTYPTILRTIVTFYRYRKSYLLSGLDRPWDFQEFEGSRSQANWHMKVVSLSALMHRPPLPRRKYSWYLFLLETEQFKQDQFKYVCTIYGVRTFVKPKIPAFVFCTFEELLFLNLIEVFTYEFRKEPLLIKQSRVFGI
jgi:hypothetical protein